MILYVYEQDHRLGEFVIRSFDDLKQVFKEFPEASHSAIGHISLKGMAESVARYLSSHHLDAWVEDSEDFEKNVKSTIAGIGLLAGLTITPTKLHDPKFTSATEHITSIKDKDKNIELSKFGTQPEDHFLHNIMQVESSGGKNITHPTTNYGVQKGHKAIGRFALMPNTIKEIAKRYNKQGRSHPDIDAISNMSPAQASKHVTAKPHVELELARTLARHVLNRHNGDVMRSAYAWKYGHNILPSEIDPLKLKNDRYLQKFKHLDQGNSVEGLVPASTAFKKNDALESISATLGVDQEEPDFKKRLNQWIKSREVSRNKLISQNSTHDMGNVRQPETVMNENSNYERLKYKIDEKNKS